MSQLVEAAALGGFLEDALEVADTMGMTDEAMIPVWPEEIKRMNPRGLTVGSLRALAAALEAGEGPAQRCESGLEACGEVVTASADGVPLCRRCADELLAEARAVEPVPSPGAPTERERRLARGIEHLAYVGILKADDHDVYAQLLDEARAVLASPATESPTNYPCSDCGAPRTKEQGGTTFTVCDECWDRHYKKPSPATESEPRAWLEVGSCADDPDKGIFTAQVCLTPTQEEEGEDVEPPFLCVEWSTEEYRKAGVRRIASALGLQVREGA